MPQRLQPFIQTLILVFTLCNQQALAASCYEPSPYKGDDYYNLENADKLSFEQKRALKNLLRNMNGKWQGHLDYVECTGPDNAPIVIEKHAKLSAKNKFDSRGELSIQVEKLFTEQRVKMIEALNLLGNRNIFHFKIKPQNHLTFSEKYRIQNIVTPSADITKPSSNNQTIIDRSANSNKKLETKYQLKKKRKTSRITETIYDIKFDNGLLVIAREYYTNGVYTGEEVWRLSPNW